MSHHTPSPNNQSDRESSLMQGNVSEGPNLEDLTPPDKIISENVEPSQGNPTDPTFYQYSSQDRPPATPPGFQVVDTGDNSYTSTLTIPDEEGNAVVVQVVKKEDLQGESCDKDMCVLGSKDHIKFLKEKIAYLQEEANNWDAQLGQLQSELNRFERTDTDLSSVLRQARPRSEFTRRKVHHTVKQFGGNADEIYVVGKDDFEDLQELNQKFHNGAVQVKPVKRMDTQESIVGYVRSPTFVEEESEEEEEEGAFDFIYKRPKVRQYFVKNRLYREAEEHKTSWLELFYDLIFVGAVAQVGHFWSEEPSFLRAVEMFVIFGPIWRLLQDLNNYNDQIDHGEDLFYKTLMYVIMSCTVGMAINAYNVWYLVNGYSTGVLFYSFYLVARCLFMLSQIGFGTFHFPQWRLQHYVNATIIFVPSIFWLASILVEQSEANLNLLLGLRWTALLLEFFLAAGFIFVFRKWNVFFKRPPPQTRIAVNIEHTAERHGLFIIIVLGEMVVALLYPNGGLDSKATVDVRYWKAILGLLVSLALEWLYFDGVSKIKTHALRVAAMNGVFWGNLHFPLSAFLLMAGSSMASLVASYDNSNAHRRGFDERAGGGSSYVHPNQVWGFVAPLALAVLTMTLISGTHVYDSTPQRLNSWGKRGAAIIGAISLALVGLGGSLGTLTGLAVIGISAALLVLLVIVEMWGRVKKNVELMKLVELDPDGKACEVIHSTKAKVKKVMRRGEYETGAEKGEENAGINQCCDMSEPSEPSVSERERA